MNKLLIIFSIISVISCLQYTAPLDTYTQNLLLSLHNQQRTAVGLGNLIWNTTLASQSQTWANYLSTTKQLYHSGTAWVGENLASSTYGSSTMAASLFGQWAAEKQYFNPSVVYGPSSTTNSNEEVGHYTQVIWSMTYAVGCGIANGTYQATLVCQYIYSGNFPGNWVYVPSATNPWMAAQPIPNPAAMAPPSSPNTYPTVLSQAVINELLNLHNTDRQFVGMANVTWSTSIAATAQAWANKQAKAGTFYMSGTPGVGENMKLTTIQPDEVKFLYEQWSNEKTYFDATKRYPECAINNYMISHYTQIVWSATTTIGCGLATGSVNTLLVCQYSLAGNYIGNYVVYPAPAANFNWNHFKF